MFTTHDGFAKNLVSCFYIDGRGLTKLERAMSIPSRSDENKISVIGFQEKDSDTEQDNCIFDAASQSTVAQFIHTSAGTSAIDEDRGFETALSPSEREASLKQREQEMDNRERDIAEQERNLKERDILLADLRGLEKIDIAHLEAALSDIFKGLEGKLIELAEMTSSNLHPSPMTAKKNSLIQIKFPKTSNDGIEEFEATEVKLAGYDKALKVRHAEANAREIALARFQLAIEKRGIFLNERGESTEKLEAQVQERGNLARDRTEELDTLSRSLTRRDELLNERETELAARAEAEIRLLDQLDADREILEAREAAMERGFQGDYEQFDTYHHEHGILREKQDSVLILIYLDLHFITSDTSTQNVFGNAFENEVKKLLYMIKIHLVHGLFFLKDSSIHQSEKIKPLLLASPEPSLIFRFGLESRDVTFVRVKSANFRGSEQVFALEHLWKTPGGYVIVRDLLYFTHILKLKDFRLQESPAVQRLITLLDNHEQNPGFEPMNDGSGKLKYVPVKSVHNLLKSKRSIRKSFEFPDTVNVATETQSTLNTAVNNDEKSMRCLVDCNGDTAHNQKLQVAKGESSEAGLLLAVTIPHSAKASQDQKSHLISRRLNLRELEHSYAIRLSVLRERESIMKLRETDHRSRYAYYGQLFAAMRKKEDGFEARETAVAEREDIANALDKTLQDRMHSLEIDEEFQALKASQRNEALKTRSYSLHEREELVVLGRSAMRAREAHVTRRECLVETRGKKLEGVEQTLLAREAAVKAIEAALDLRESAVKASEDAISQREEAVRSENATIKHDKDRLKLYEANLRYTEERLQKKDEKLNWEFTNRELLVIEREQKIEAMEGASKMGWVIPMAMSKDGSDDL
ncbi:uncharacterized protein Bfra_011477 [Botrytis fragariae]|uniref:Uncharacterized protein n=1 Tax=Botrytis fragariae TaxID=1964551 RepID=A0A8H6EKN0_9HELO|nr:uncharacterized protein Bfra_011477 [Botrytis fragariae]KAF5875714.1 hypothetical protein Bfra_011477 [Botrytis fragariae]